MGFDRLKRLEQRGLAHPPKWLEPNVQYAVIMGSVAYGASSDTSDMDIYGWAIPPKQMVFPHLAGEIAGFGTQIQKFEQYQQHHIIDKEESQEYDLTIYSIVKFFQLCMENNPNMLSALNVPQRCVLTNTRISQIVRDNRDSFLHLGSYSKFRGYAYSQISKMKGGANRSNQKRQADIEAYGYSTKFAYHIVRLALEAEQILIEHTLEVDKNGEILKSIRRGEWTIEELENWFNEKEKHLEELKAKSTLRVKPDEEFLKSLLLRCLEEHYGSLTEAVRIENNGDRILREVQAVLDKYH